MAAQFQFVMRSGPTIGKVYPLEAQEISIGRDATSVVMINDAEVSRRHAKMELHGSAYVIQDLGSTNGTFVNGVRISGAQVLNPGDTISFGEGIVLAYEFAIDVDATILSVKPSQTAVQIPASAPAPAPVPAAPAYSGKVPAGPVPAPAAAVPAKKGGSRTVIIIVVVVVILILCLCVGLPLIADALKLDCVVPFKWFFNIVGPLGGFGVCP